MKKIWAHRGSSGYITENTLAAFQLAIEQGADGIELDVQMTKDGELVVYHDESLERVSNGVGFVKDYTLKELKLLHLKELGKEDHYIYTIPTLREVYELVKPYHILVNVELKTGIFPYKGIEQKVLHLTEEMGMEDRVLYSSFNHQTLLRLKAIRPEARTAMLIQDVLVDVGEYAKALGVEAIHPMGYQLLMPEVLQEMLDSGLEIHPWTINSYEDIARVEQLPEQVNVYITNYPDRIN